MKPEGIILKHHQRWLKLDYHQVEKDFNTETAMKNDYGGRFVVELFQNAADRAERQIWITAEQQQQDGPISMTFANDGEPFSIYPLPEPGKYEERLSDFHALCSMFTSSKMAGKSIGNKGVGFKSCWEFAKKCRVVSRTKDGQAWGFRLYRPLKWSDIEDWQGDYKENVLEKRIDWRERLPSYYFPEPLTKEVFQSDLSRYPNAVTIITLEGIDGDDKSRLRALLEEFNNVKLVFIPLVSVWPKTLFFTSWHQ